MKNNLNNLIKSLNFGYVNTNINEKNFPYQKPRKIEVFKLDTSFTKDETIKFLKEENCEPANIYDLLNWAKNNWKGEDVLALGSELLVDGFPGVVCLWSDAGNRKLSLHWTGFRWYSGSLVAGVRKSLRNSDNKKLRPLESLDLKKRVKILEGELSKLKKVINF